MSILIDANEQKISDGTAYDEYFAYIETIKDQLPLNVYLFAQNPKYKSLDDPSSLHDSWVDSLSLIERHEGQRNEVRNQEVEVVLMGAFHDRKIKIQYLHVSEYEISSSDSTHGNGDWLIDEISLYKDRIEHSIRFSTGAKWKIIFDDMRISEEMISAN